MFHYICLTARRSWVQVPPEAVHVVCVGSLQLPPKDSLLFVVNEPKPQHWCLNAGGYLWVCRSWTVDLTEEEHFNCHYSVAHTEHFQARWSQADICNYFILNIEKRGVFGLEHTTGDLVGSGLSDMLKFMDIWAGVVVEGVTHQRLWDSNQRVPPALIR